MGLLDTLQSVAQRALGFDLKSGLPSFSTTGSRYQAPDRRAFEQQAKAYMNQVVLACIATRAQTLNEPPLFAVDPSTKQPIPQHPLSRLFRRPNPDMSQSMFWQYVSTYIDIGGNAYIHKVRNVYGQVIELRPYHSGHIVPVSESGEWVDYYRYQYEGVSKDIDRRDIIHLRSYYIDPLNPVLGISPIRAAGINVDTYNELMNTLYSYLRNNGVPSGVLSVQSALNAGQVEQLKEQWQNNTTGKNRGRPVVLPSGMTFTQMGLNVSNLEASSQFAQYETAICGIYRVHPSVVMTTAGLMSSTYSNMQTAFQEYTLLTRVPTWNTWEEQVELAFVDEYPEVDVEFDTSNVAALQSDPDAVIYPVVAQFNANLITVNEARQRMGYPPSLQDGDVYSYQVIAPSPAGFMSDESMEIKAPRKPQPLPERGQIDQSADVKAEAFWQSMDKVVREYGEKLKGPTSELIRDIEDVLTPSAISGKAFKSDAELKVLIDRYMRATGKWRDQIAQEIMKMAVTEVGADFASVQGSIDDLIGQITKDMNANITASVDNIQTEISGDVATWANDELPEATTREDYIAEKLKTKFEGLSEGRAKAIARTTARATTSTVSESTWDLINTETVGDEEDNPNEIVKVWTTRRDALVRDSHRKLDGEWVVMGKNFKSGLKAPGIGSFPGETVNCRCVLRPVKRKNLGRQAG
jgi:HK97 family phage portal protein